MADDLPGAPLAGTNWHCTSLTWEWGEALQCDQGNGHTGPHSALARVRWDVPSTVSHHRYDVDEAPTERLPPISDTVRRRPPPPAALRELKGADLLHALLDAIEADPETTGEEL